VWATYSTKGCSLYKKGRDGGGALDYQRERGGKSSLDPALPRMDVLSGKKNEFKRGELKSVHEKRGRKGGKQNFWSCKKKSTGHTKGERNFTGRKYGGRGREKKGPQGLRNWMVEGKELRNLLENKKGGGASGRFWGKNDRRVILNAIDNWGRDRDELILGAKEEAKSQIQESLVAPFGWIASEARTQANQLS